MKTLIPAVFFQKQLKGEHDKVKIPERLAMFESELDAIVGGARRTTGASNVAGAARLNTGALNTDTFSYSAGWLDVEQADDCSA